MGEQLYDKCVASLLNRVSNEDLACEYHYHNSNNQAHTGPCSPSQFLLTSLIGIRPSVFPLLYTAESVTAPDTLINLVINISYAMKQFEVMIVISRVCQRVSI